MYAVMKLDYHTAWQDKRIPTYLGLLLLYSLILLVVLLVIRRQGHLQQLQEAKISQRLFTVISLVETAVVVCVTPLFSLPSLIRDEQRQPLTTLSLSPLRSTTIVLGKLALPMLMVMAVMGASVIPLAGLDLTLGGITNVTLFRTYGVLLTFALGMLTLGCFCSAVFHNLHTATGVAYLTIACAVGGVILAGPLISRLPHPERLTQFVLLLNPLIGMSSSIGFDILRSELIYAVSPLGQQRVVYPPWGTVCMWHLLSALLFFSGTVWRMAHLRRSFDRWGTFGP